MELEKATLQEICVEIGRRFDCMALSVGRSLQEKNGGDTPPMCLVANGPLHMCIGLLHSHLAYLDVTMLRNMSSPPKSPILRPVR